MWNKAAVFHSAPSLVGSFVALEACSAQNPQNDSQILSMDGAQTALEMLQDSHAEQTDPQVYVFVLDSLVHIANAEVAQIQKNCVKVSGLASVMQCSQLRIIIQSCGWRDTRCKIGSSRHSVLVMVFMTVVPTGFRSSTSFSCNQTRSFSQDLA